MSFFARAHYSSDTTQFLNRLKAEQPALEQAQRDGRALLWDKAINLEQQAQEQAGEVAQKAYVYQTSPKLG